MLRAALGFLLGVVVLCSFAESREATYIPVNLQDAHRELVRVLTAAEIEQIRALKSERDMVRYHRTLGLWIRNDWGLWQGSHLAKYFNEVGVSHPDDMSGIILDTFWCKLHDEPFRLDEKIASYREYWLSVRKPGGVSPKDGAKIVWVIS